MKKQMENQKKQYHMPRKLGEELRLAGSKTACGLCGSCGKLVQFKFL